MSYQVIARKWRPQKFSDMVGQEHIARTLRNSIMTGRIGHAYLFVGPRGIGKTTSARIFAKALNCMRPVDGEPCCECSSCKAIADETSVDVIEIDAATHTQVDKAREICEDVLHLPIASKYKIYIIDEVHMLSKSAWNALLKTIEEPPAHAKFIFATTEVNKVLPTVISRCQRFDLRRISMIDIISRLRLICDAEHVNVSDSALSVIARAADGGMRDAQSLLDQLISFFGTDGAVISEEQALTLFGLTAPESMENLVNALTHNDRAGAITAIHELAAQGKNLETLLEEIVAYLRGILLCGILSSPEQVLDESAEKIAVYARLAMNVRPDAVQRLLENLSSGSYMLREAINKQVFMESIVLKAMRVAHAVQVEDLIARLNQIRGAGGLDAVKNLVPIYEMPVGQLLTREGSPLVPESRMAADYKVVSAPVGETVAPAPVQAQIIAPAPAPAPAAVAVSADVAAKESLPENVISDDAPPSVAETPKAETSVEAQVFADMPEPVSPPSLEMERDNDLPETVPASPVSESVPEGVSDDSAELEKAESSESAPADDNEAESLWQKLILDITDTLKKLALGAAMRDAVPDSFCDSVLYVAFDNEYGVHSRSQFEKELALVTARLRVISGDPRAEIRIGSRSGIATPVAVRRRESVEELKLQASSNEVIMETQDLFSGRIVDAYDLTTDGEMS